MNKIFCNTNGLPLLERFFIVLIIFSSGTPFTADYSICNTALVFCYLLLVYRKHLIYNKYTSKLIAALIGLIILWSIQYNFSPYNYDYNVIFKYSAIIFCVVSYCINSRTDTESKIDYLIQFTVLLSFISNCLFVAKALGIDIPTIETSTHKINSFYYLGAISFSEVYGFLGYRNAGIYWEPGLYQIYLNLALMYVLYSNKTVKGIRLFLILYLTFSIYTTGSTTGLFLGALIIGIYLLYNDTPIIIRYIIIFIALFISTGMVIPFLINNLETKMNSESYFLRVNDILLGFEVFKSNPIWGYGIANNVYEFRHAQMFGEERGDSNGLANLLINFGIIGLAIFIRWCYLFIIYICRIINIKMLFTMIIWLIVSICTEPITLQAFVFMWIGLGLRESISSK